MRIWLCLTLCASLWYAVAPMPVATPLDVSPNKKTQLGLNTHLATRLHYRSTIPVAAEVVANSNTQWVREDIHWYRIQRTPTAYDWQFYDDAFDVLTQHQLQILGVLGHPPGWATPDPYDDPYNNTFSAPDAERFAAWAAQTVARYRHQIRYWQIWNEPDNTHFWRPSPDPVAYARLVILTSRAIKHVAPEAVIVSAGVNPFHMAFLTRAAEAGLWSAIDVVAIHPYVNPNHPVYSGLSQAIHYLDGLQSRYGRRPVWVTELGWASGASDRDPPSATPTYQADYLRQSIPLLWQAGIEVVFWYTFKDEAHNPYGLIAWGSGSDDMQPHKPAFATFRQLGQMQAIPQQLTAIPITSFEGRKQTWVRGDEPYGSVQPQLQVVYTGRRALRMDYAFPRGANRYVVFNHRRPLRIPTNTYALSIMLYGNNQSHEFKLWLKGGDGAVVQLQIAPLGGTGWRRVVVPIPAQFNQWDLITPGDGQLSSPVSIEAIVLDDNPDGSGQSGTFYIDQIMALVPSP
jgi:polysaccharide biosynthesis protein PslG